MADCVLINNKFPTIYVVGEMRLLPGQNEVRRQVWDSVKKNPGVLQQIEKGLLEIDDKLVKEPAKKSTSSGKSGSPAEDKGYVLAGFSPKEAKAKIVETYNVEVLKSWFEEETRKAVKDAISKQIEIVLKKDDKDEKKK